MHILHTTLRISGLFLLGDLFYNVCVKYVMYVLSVLQLYVKSRMFLNPQDKNTLKYNVTGLV